VLLSYQTQHMVSDARSARRSCLESQFIVGSRLHILLILIFGGLRRQQNVLFASVACPQGSSGKNMAGMFDVLLVELP
jgi:hypothetical protein